MNEELIIKFGFKKDNCCYHYRNNNNIKIYEGDITKFKEISSFMDWFYHQVKEYYLEVGEDNIRESIKSILNIDKLERDIESLERNVYDY